MRTLGLRVAVAISAFMVGVVLDAVVNTSTLVEDALAYPVKSIERILGTQIEIPERVIPFDAARPTEITFDRILPVCFGCPIKRIVLRTKGSRGEFEDAKVIEIDLQTGQRRDGILDSYDYRNLLRFIESQGYFAMNDQYTTRTIESAVVRTSVSIGDRHKSIVTASEGKVPPALWGIHYAIEGVLNHVNWEGNR